MQKAVFFSGAGTVYAAGCSRRDDLEVYTETLAALRFLARRGFALVLVTNERQEYKSFVSQLKDKSFPILHFNPCEDELGVFVEMHDISLSDSYFVTDRLLPKVLVQSCSLVLVLSGQGVCTLATLDEKNGFRLRDVCKDIYAAAFSIALEK